LIASSGAALPTCRRFLNAGIAVGKVFSTRLARRLENMLK